ncbi:hypothetical protein BMH28_12605, partial [Leucobacter sp. OLCS4]
MAGSAIPRIPAGAVGAAGFAAGFPAGVATVTAGRSPAIGAAVLPGARIGVAPRTLRRVGGAALPFVADSPARAPSTPGGLASVGVVVGWCAVAAPTLIHLCLSLGGGAGARTVVL